MGLPSLGKVGLKGVKLPPGRRNPRKGQLKGGKFTPWTPQPGKVCLKGINLPPGRRNPRKGWLKGGKFTPFLQRYLNELWH